MKSLANDIETILPNLRRYARATTGDQAHGDDLAEAALRRLIASWGTSPQTSLSKVALFQAFHDGQDRRARPTDGALSPDESRAHLHLSKLTSDSRQALLLRAFERFDDDEIATIMGIDAARVAELITTARHEISQAISGRILIIEDEARVATRIEDILIEMGHKIIGQAARHDDAVSLVAQSIPDLILSDIQLADGDDGVETVSDILQKHPGVPVIFVTGFPERLLTGQGPEPVFLITKPFSKDQVRSAVSQAMFFAERTA